MVALKPASSSYGSVPVSKLRPSGLVARGPGLVGPPPFDHLGPPVGDTEMGAAELVRRADQHVGVDVTDVDRLVRRVVDGVHPGQRPGRVRELAHAAGVGDRADRVGGPGERDHLGPRPELAFQVAEVQGRVVVQLDVPHHQIAVVRDLQPGRDAGVVVEARDQDLVARAERAGRGPGQREVERGHVGPEDHLAGLAAQEPGRLALGLLEDLPDPEAGGVARAQVGAGLPERQRHRVAHLVGDLGAARGVEERETLPQRGEAGPDRVDVHACAEHFGHGSSLLRGRPGNAARRYRIHNCQPRLRVVLLPWRKRRWFDQRYEIGPLGRAY